jgi:biopolymer transport protein ExbD
VHVGLCRGSLRAHRETRYQTLAEVLSEAQRAGIRRIGLVTDPSLEAGVP